MGPLHAGAEDGAGAGAGAFGAGAGEGAAAAPGSTVWKHFSQTGLPPMFTRFPEHFGQTVGTLILSLPEALLTLGNTKLPLD
ncbi:MAG: hypothetical protein EKK48_28835 [Candidatus Melainabacteria bacterium]|nr:MAG: hypothetical protein EKK48_28835 [Candidatus Melainabacteria bacterium]